MPPAMDRFLLPVPKEVHFDAGGSPVGPDSSLGIRVDDPRVESALIRWRSRFSRGGEQSRQSPIVLSVDATTISHPQGYRLKVTPNRIELVGGSAAGCFYGLQTLHQLSNFAAGEVPCGTIVDWPGFDTRGLLHDVTRGKVPTSATLRLMADRLASLKVNQLQLYIEHAFVFSFDPTICGPDDGLTAGEIRELDRYCQERFIELVPALATFGHMGRILSMPKYRQLAEIEARKEWSQMSWPERARGLTLDCMNPEAQRLVERLWADVLDAFSSPVVNICGDEPWDLGQGRNKQRFAAGGKGEAYIEHLRRTHDFCADRGRRTQFWSDVIRHDPGLADRVPQDSTVLHWGYDDQADYDGTAQFVRAGLKTFVCPGTSGWKRIINALGLAERNIAKFAAAGKKFGATGLLTADWGDHGHFNPLACSWHGMGLGAALGWDANHPTGAAFDARFAYTVLGIDDPSFVQSLRRLSEWAETCETWRMLWMPCSGIQDDPTLPGLEQAEQVQHLAHEALRQCKQMASGGLVDPTDLNELSLSCYFSELLADKVVLIQQHKKEDGSSRLWPRCISDWVDRMAEAAKDYSACWRIRNKPSGLNDVRTALSRATHDLLEWYR